VLFGILNGIDPMGADVVLVNLYGTCPVVPLGVMMLGVKPCDGGGFEESGVGDGAIGVRGTDAPDGGGGTGDGATVIGDGGIGDGDGTDGEGDGGIGDGDGTDGEGDGGIGDGDGTDGDGGVGTGLGTGPGAEVVPVVLFFLHLQNFFSGFGGAGLYGGTVGREGGGPVIGSLPGIKTGSSNMNIGIGSSPPIRTGSSPPIKTGSSPPIRTGSSHKGISIGSSPYPEKFPLIGIGSSIR